MSGSAYRMLDSLEGKARLLARALAAGGLTVLLALAAMMLVDGLARSLFGQPLDAVRDLSGVLAAISIASCVPMALLRHSNVTIRLLGSFFSGRVTRIGDTAAAVLVCVVIGGMAVEMLSYAQKVMHAGEATWMLNIPTAPFWYFVGGALSCAFLVQLLVVARTFQAFAIERSAH